MIASTYESFAWEGGNCGHPFFLPLHCQGNDYSQEHQVTNSSLNLSHEPLRTFKPGTTLSRSSTSRTFATSSNLFKPLRQISLNLFSLVGSSIMSEPLNKSVLPHAPARP
jgi:hypothetical protein